ncbi:hypothetical protein BOTBODRAFT_37556 [Botryobasidium botryosum FD-172 SS1]|uniref:HMG box domain-containing protein n=1 Tax=Botryobasidium botryosum (strain FD-172 SS1) TaxID=930990 RepID=A0A067MAK5_BOTB1|nr:hypothetical protein BOTBODRAFT_37556 [Botryobasidium botryosum FD-172 SS1]
MGPRRCLLTPLPLLSHRLLPLPARAKSLLSPPNHHLQLPACRPFTAYHFRATTRPMNQFTFTLQTFPMLEPDPPDLAEPAGASSFVDYAIFDAPPVTTQQPSQLYWYPPASYAYGSYSLEAAYSDAAPGDISPDLNWPSNTSMYSMPEQFQQSFDDLPSLESNYCFSPASVAPDVPFSPYESNYSMQFTPTISHTSIPGARDTIPFPIHAEGGTFAPSTPTPIPHSPPTPTPSAMPMFGSSASSAPSCLFETRVPPPLASRSRCTSPATNIRPSASFFIPRSPPPFFNYTATFERRPSPIPGQLRWMSSGTGALAPVPPSPAKPAESAPTAIKESSEDEGKKRRRRSTDSGKDKERASHAKSLLHPPKQAPSTWQIFFTDQLRWYKDRYPNEKLNVAQVAKEVNQVYKNLAPEEMEVYKQRAQAAKEEYERQLAAWKRTLTPADVKAENQFRTAQRKAGKSKRGNLKDPNAPKKPLSAYFMFLQMIRSDPEMVREVFGDEESTTKQSVLAAVKWRSLTDAEKKPFLAQAEKEKLEYEVARQEYEEITSGVISLSGFFAPQLNDTYTLETSNDQSTEEESDGAAGHSSRL